MHIGYTQYNTTVCICQYVFKIYRKNIFILQKNTSDISEIIISIKNKNDYNLEKLVNLWIRIDDNDYKEMKEDKLLTLAISSIQQAPYVISPNIIVSHLPNVVNISEIRILKHIRPSGN